MKHVALLIACTLPLMACGKSAKVDLHNATGNQVNDAVKQSGVMTGNGMIEPGLWQSKTTVQEMSIPGMPAQFAERMKQSMATHQNQTSSHCVTEADVKKPKEDFFGADKSCKYDHFTMGGGKIDIAMTCKGDESSQTTKISGSYTPTTYSLDMASNGSGGERGMGMVMKMHVDSRRVGECTGKED